MRVVSSLRRHGEQDCAFSVETALRLVQSHTDHTISRSRELFQIFEREFTPQRVARRHKVGMGERLSRSAFALRGREGVASLRMSRYVARVWKGDGGPE